MSTPHDGTWNGQPATIAIFDKRMGFAQYWDFINAKRKGCAWKDNPWVWALSFSRL